MNQERETVACAERIVERTYNCGELEIEAKIVAQAFLALRSGGEGWQDISTAPKDGGAVDLYADGRRWTDFAWNVGLKRWERQEGYPATTRVLLIEPTHFMVALPPPPSIQGEGA